MRQFQFLQYTAAAIASLGLVLPSAVSAAETSLLPMAANLAAASPAAAPSILDVGLGAEGMLSGQVLDGDGAPMARTIVTARNAGNEVASAFTDRQGYFSIHGLHGGVYEVTSGGSSGVFRLWTANASPPSANKEILIVAGGPLARGQCCGKCAGQCTCPAGPRLIGTPTNGQVVIAGLVVAGLAGGITAVALSVHEHQSGS